ncbi:MAG: peptidase [Geminicoccaceae bacterium]|nr:peptidase [Geminicoccaceae bacterium]
MNLPPDRPISGSLTLAAASFAAAFGAADVRAQSVSSEAIVANYADVAAAMYGDALTTATRLHDVVDAFLEAPDEAGLLQARQAWLAARVPYQQTEAYRFGNPMVDEWEGRVNAWPLDEGLIDYVDRTAYGAESPENAYYAADIVGNEQVKVGGHTLDATVIDAALLRDLHEIDAIEANVSRGYHAIEFLLWGQDLNGTEAGAGERPWTDYSLEGCTNGHCDRRAAYLRAAVDLLVADLEEMATAWRDGGEARAALLEREPSSGLAVMLTGLGSLSYGELAGERMQLGLMLHDPEEEHDCFSDNTHNSHYYDQAGMQAVAHGRYERVDGSTVEGPSLLDLLAVEAPEVARDLSDALDATSEAMRAMKERAEGGEAYDQMIGAGNEEGNAVVQRVIDRLKDQTRAIEAAVAALDLSPIAIEGSDSLDDPNAVFFQ